LNGCLFGLGQAHIETTLSAWIPQARVIGVEPTLITLAVMFVVAGQNTSIIPFPERLQKAMGELRVHSATDPRQVLLSALSPDTINALVVRADTPRLCTFMGTLVGMDIPDSIRAALSNLRPDFDAINLSNAAELLALRDLSIHKLPYSGERMMFVNGYWHASQLKFRGRIKLRLKRPSEVVCCVVAFFTSHLLSRAMCMKKSCNFVSYCLD
jgi:hypothetical protein